MKKTSSISCLQVNLKERISPPAALPETQSKSELRFWTGRQWGLGLACLKFPSILPWEGLVCLFVLALTFLTVGKAEVLISGLQFITTYDIWGLVLSAALDVLKAYREGLGYFYYLLPKTCRRSQNNSEEISHISSPSSNEPLILGSFLAENCES